MNNINNNSIEVLLAKYIDNQATEKEALTILQALSQSKELRGIFCLAIAGQRRMQGMTSKACLRKTILTLFN